MSRMATSNLFIYPCFRPLCLNVLRQSPHENFKVEHQRYKSYKVVLLLLARRRVRWPGKNGATVSLKFDRRKTHMHGVTMVLTDSTHHPQLN